ncbi:MAG: hypothetical protein JW947_03925 [Sedimentisphaerales bacterium]|nr:hypothetical protein [Sedimentisphaerales bacterium]
MFRFAQHDKQELFYKAIIGRLKADKVLKRPTRLAAAAAKRVGHNAGAADRPQMLVLPDASPPRLDVRRHI